MKIQWVRSVKPERKPAANKKNEISKNGSALEKSSTGGEVASTAGAEKEEEVKIVYSIVPDNIVLNPKMGIMIQVRANSAIVGRVVENWHCNVTSGGERKPKIAYNTNIQGDFITPQLIFSPADAKLFFKYLWEKGVPSMPICKNLEITNGGPLPTTMNLLIDPPFSCATEKLTLQP